MKILTGVIAAFTSGLLALPMQTQAQTGAVGVGTADSTSSANSNSGASAGASAGYTVNNYSTGRSELVQSGTATIKNAPAVQAPSVFGGGHPCLAGKSGGISVIGGGISYGQGNPEPACMAWVMGQPEVAIRIMMRQSPEFCAAMNNVGYYRVGKSVVPIQCGRDVVRGGVDTAGVASRTTRVSTRNSPATGPQERPALFSKCYMRDDGRIGVVFTKVGKANREIAAKACQQSLGY